MSMEINVAASFNEKYVKYAYVMVYSLLKNQNRDDFINVYVFESDISEDSKELFYTLFENYNGEINFLHVNPDTFPSELKVNDQWSQEIYYRLLASEMVTDKECLLYLDVDIIVNGSLRKLFELDWNGRMLYAYPDVSRIPFGDIRDIFFKNPLENGYQYFCSGIMLMNLKKIRERYKVSDFWDLAKKWEYKMIAPDQDLLNGIFWNQVGYFEEAYSVFGKLAFNNGRTYEDIRDYAKIVHYIGDKPWQGHCVHYDIEKLWWDYAKETPFYQEFLEDFVTHSIEDNLVYNVLDSSMKEKEQLREELGKATVLLKKLAAMIEGK